MGNLPTADELKGQLLKVIDEATFNKTLADLQMQTPIYKTKTGIMAAYSMIAKLHNVKLDFGLKFTSKIAPEEIMPENQFLSFNQVKNTPFKVVNVRGWIVGKGQLGRTKKTDKPMLSFALADDKGTMDPIWIYGEEAETFSKMLDYKVGNAITIYHLGLRDTDPTKNWFRLEKNHRIEVCKEPPCALNMVNLGALANLTDGFITIKAMIISDMEEIEKHGCQEYHYLDGEPGVTVPCAGCKGVPREIITYLAARVVIADETAQLPMEISGRDYKENKPSFTVGNGYLIRGRFAATNKLFYCYESFDLGKYVENTAAIISGSSPVASINSVIVHTETPEMRIWWAVKQKTYHYQETDASIVKTLSDAGVINDPKGDNHFITFFQQWTEVEDLLKPDPAKEVKNDKPLPTVELFVGNEETLIDPPPELVEGFILRYTKVHARVYPSLTKELLYECIGKNADQNYRAKPFVTALIAANKAELVWLKDAIVLNAK